MENGNNGDMVFSNMNQFWWNGCCVKMAQNLFQDVGGYFLNIAGRGKMF